MKSRKTISEQDTSTDRARLVSHRKSMYSSNGTPLAPSIRRTRTCYSNWGGTGTCSAESAHSCRSLHRASARRRCAGGSGASSPRAASSSSAAHAHTCVSSPQPSHTRSFTLTSLQGDHKSMLWALPYTEIFSTFLIDLLDIDVQNLF